MGLWLLIALGGSLPVERLAVLTFIVSEGTAPLRTSDIHQAVGRAVELRPQLALLSQEELFVADVGTLGARIEDCGTDAACLSAYLQTFAARFGLLVVLNYDLEPPLVGLRLVDTQARSVAEAAGQFEEPLQAIEAEAAKLLDDAGHPRWSELTISTTPAGAALRVSGGVPPRSANGTLYLLPPGSHDVAASLEGHRSVTETVELSAGERRALRLALSRTPTAPFYETWWFWTIVGGVVVAGATAGVVVAATREPEICVGRPDLLDGC